MCSSRQDFKEARARQCIGETRRSLTLVRMRMSKQPEGVKVRKTSECWHSSLWWSFQAITWHVWDEPVRACIGTITDYRTLAERTLEQYLAILQRPQVNSFGLSCSLVQNRPALLTVLALLEKQWPQVFRMSELIGTFHKASLARNISEPNGISLLVTTPEPAPGIFDSIMLRLKALWTDPRSRSRRSSSE
jgi:hypothetical protein